MSWKASAWVKERNHTTTGRRFSHAEKLLLLVLADYHNPEWGYASPSLGRLADEALQSARHARRLLRDLVRDQVLVVEEHYRPDGSRSANRYYFSGLDTLPDTMSPAQSDEDATSGGPDPQVSGPPDTQMSGHEPPLNRHREPSTPANADRRPQLSTARRGEEASASPPTASSWTQQLCQRVAARGDLDRGAIGQLRGWTLPVQAAIERLMADGWTLDELIACPEVVDSPWHDAAHAGRVLVARLDALAGRPSPSQRARRTAMAAAAENARVRCAQAEEEAIADERDHAAAEILRLAQPLRRRLRVAARDRCCVPPALPDDHPRIADAEKATWVLWRGEHGSDEAVHAYLRHLAGLRAGGREPAATSIGLAR